MKTGCDTVTGFRGKKNTERIIVKRNYRFAYCFWLLASILPAHFGLPTVQAASQTNITILYTTWPISEDAPTKEVSVFNKIDQEWQLNAVDVLERKTGMGK